MTEITKLLCPACGAKIELKGNSGQITCAYCGTQLQIENQKGEIAAMPPALPVNAVKSVIDRNASEIEINKIKEEITFLKTQQIPYLAKWNRLRAIHSSKVTNYKLWAKIFAWSLLGSFILLLVGAATTLMVVGILAFLLFFAGIIALIIIGCKAWRQKIFQRKYEKMSQLMVSMDEQIKEKYKELEKYKAIAESKGYSGQHSLTNLV